MTRKRLLPFYPASPAGFARILVFLLIAISFAVYADSLGNQFVYDDDQLVVDNEFIRDASNLADYVPGTKKLASYRPVRFLSYMLDYALWGLNPAGFRLTNIILHGLNAALVFSVCMLLGLRLSGSFVAALLFLLHPLQTESVAYISGRRDLLFTFFYLLAIRFALARSMRLTAWASITVLALFILALFSKEMALSMPLLLLWCSLWLEIRDDDSKNRYEQTLKAAIRYLLASYQRAWPFFSLVFLVAAAFAFYKIVYWNPSDNLAYWGGNPLNTLLTVALIWTYYVGLILLPIPLKGDYSIAAFPLVENSHQLLPWVAILLILAAFLLLMSITRRHPLICFGGIWFGLTLLPVSHIVPHHELMAEHYLYMPIVGFAIIAGHFYDRYSKRWARTTLALFLIILSVYSTRTIVRLEDWRDSLSFWTSCCRFEPVAARACLNVGFLYLERGDEKKFVAFNRRSLAIKPTEKAWYNFGLYHEGKAEYEKAVVAYKKSLQLNTLYEAAAFNLAMLYHRMGEGELARSVIDGFVNTTTSASMQFARGFIAWQEHSHDQAILSFTRTLSIDPGYEGAAYYSGLAMYENDAFAAAAEAFRKEMNLRNRYYRSAYTHYFAALGAAGRVEESIEAIQGYLAEFPTDREAKLSLARLFMIRRDAANAERVFNDILRGDHVCAECYLALGIIQRDFHRDLPEAIRLLNLSLDVNPDQPDRALLITAIEKMQQQLPQ